MTASTRIKVFTLLLVCTVAASVPIKCKFSLNEPLYICTVDESSAQFLGKQLAVSAIQGNHLPGMTNADVTVIDFRKIKNLGVFPKGLEKFFPNLWELQADSVNLKQVSQADLKPFKKLMYFNAPNNHLTTITGDLFKANHEIRDIHLTNNPISSIAPNAFDGLNYLTWLQLDGLKCKGKLSKARGKAAVKALVAQIKKGACKKVTLYSVVMNVYDDDVEEDEETFEADEE